MEIEFTGVDLDEVPAVKRVLDTRPPGDSVTAFLSALRGELLRCGYMLSRVVVDGREVGGEEESAFSRTPTDGIERVEVEVAPTGDFVSDTFDECLGAVSRLQSLRDDIATAVRSGEVARVADDFARFAQGLSLLTTAYQDGIHLLVQLGVAGNEDIDRCALKMTRLGQVLREILVAIDTRDLVVVSDALEYEFPDHLSGLSDEFSSWTEQIRGSDAATGCGAPRAENRAEVEDLVTEKE